jgi:hypothetical protein
VRPLGRSCGRSSCNACRLPRVLNTLDPGDVAGAPPRRRHRKAAIHPKGGRRALIPKYRPAPWCNPAILSSMVHFIVKSSGWMFGEEGLEWELARLNLDRRPLGLRFTSHRASARITRRIHMARSTRHEAGRLSASIEGGLPDLTEITVSEGQPLGESEAAFETLNLGHANLRSECWSGVCGSSSRGDHVSPRPGMWRLRRPRRNRTRLHSARPSEAAEARFTSDSPEFLTS